LKTVEEWLLWDNGAFMNATYDHLYDTVRRIPKGRVETCGVFDIDDKEDIWLAD